MKIISIANRKGGVGKSTTAAALMAGLSLKGFKVLGIDLDGQMNLTHSLDVEPGEASAYEVLTKEIGAAEAVQKTSSGFLIPASKALSVADINITQTGKEYRLRDALAERSDEYDFCIIDCPPALGILTVNALTAADGVIIAAQADIFSLEGIDDLRDSIDLVKQYCNHGLTIKGILLTRFSPRPVLSQNVREMAEEMAKNLGTKVYKATIREAIAVKEAQISRQSHFDYAPKANVTQDYKDFIKEFLRRAKEEK